MTEVRVGAYRHPVAVGQRSQTRRQVLRGRHRRVIHQEGDDWDVPFDSRLDLHPHKVVGVVEPTHPGGLGRGEPSGTDDGQEDITSTDGIADRLVEVPPQGNRVHVLEDVVSATRPDQPIVDPIGGRVAVVAAVGEEDVHRGQST